LRGNLHETRGIDFSTQLRVDRYGGADPRSIFERPARAISTP
jgi:hypothetical protein